MPRSQTSVMPPVEVFQRPGTRTRRPGVRSGERMLAPSDVTEIGGVRVTTPIRTACDLGRLLWRFDALAALDAFLHLGVDHASLLAEVRRYHGYRGVKQLRTLTLLADRRSESVAESWLRLFWHDAGLPTPQLQWWVCNDLGTPIFRLDLALPEAQYATEYDGEQFHSCAEARTYDDDRRSWLDTQRSWHLEVFGKADLYVPRADPIPRLQQGLSSRGAASRCPRPTPRCDRNYRVSAS